MQRQADSLYFHFYRLFCRIRCGLANRIQCCLLLFTQADQQNPPGTNFVVAVNNCIRSFFSLKIAQFNQSLNRTVELAVELGIQSVQLFNIGKQPYGKQICFALIKVNRPRFQFDINNLFHSS